MAWKVNDEAMAKATAGMGFKYPVRVRLMARGPQGMVGKYHGLGRRGPTVEGVLDKPAHHISLRADLTTSFANTALWHELTHAYQAERYLPVEANGEEPHILANRGLTMDFRKEMKDVRRRSGTTSKALTMAYSNVSFEKEAQDSSTWADKFSLIEEVATDTPAAKSSSLYDENGRATWRVDLWRDGKWNKKAKQRDPSTFMGTYYVLAKDEFDAKRWVREQANVKFHDSTAAAYQIVPRSKEGGK